jgi:hypothetical protein
VPQLIDVKAITQQVGVFNCLFHLLTGKPTLQLSLLPTCLARDYLLRCRAEAATLISPSYPQFLLQFPIRLVREDIKLSAQPDLVLNARISVAISCWYCSWVGWLALSNCLAASDWLIRQFIIVSSSNDGAAPTLTHAKRQVYDDAAVAFR